MGPAHSNKFRLGCLTAVSTHHTEAYFSLQNSPKTFVGRALPGPTGRAQSAPHTIQLASEGRAPEKGKTSEGTKMKEGRNGERGRERGEERGTKVERNGGREGEWGRKEGGREEKGRMPPPIF